ncbi:MAG: tetratricopeptide repeat protein, partial [Chloroflexota bacterium]
MSDRYVIHEALGAGGMGIVHRATNRLSGEIVALKQVTVDFERARSNAWLDEEVDQDLRLALAHEFQTLASLRHPNIISVLDYGFDLDGQPYFTMTYLPEAETVISAGENRTFVDQVALLQQVLQALSYLHRQGILHRDLKPENVLVTNSVVRVLDFGLASAIENVSSSAGSWAFIAPEVLEDQPSTEASDLYAVGVLAYQMVTGKLPFDPVDPDFLDKLLDQPPDLSSIAHDAFSQVIGRLLSKDPTIRYPSAEATIEAFSRAVNQPVPHESRAIRESFLQAAQFVGREAELGQLIKALDNAIEGHGSSWLVGGESGVGKSRLLAELRTRALVSGTIVLRGKGIQDGGTVYQVWHDVLRRLLLSSVIDDLAMGVLQPLIPDIDRLLDREIIAAPELTGQAGQQRLLSTITSLFRQQPRPILLILEDMQWIGESIVVLHQLNRLAADHPMLIVGSYRHDERPSLPNELPEMTLLQLDRLTEVDMISLSTAMLGQAGQRPDVLALLHRETEGNAFFLVEVVRALAKEAGRLNQIGQTELPLHLFPDGIRTIVERRLAQIPVDAQALLTIAAIAGREIDLNLLQALSPQNQSEAYLESWLMVCAQAAVIEVQGSVWQFTHDKLREGVFSMVDDEDRRDKHAQIAQALIKIYPGDATHAASLTYHWHQAGQVDKERIYAKMAGYYALDHYANEDALQYLSRAINLTSDLELQERYELLLAREGVLHLQGKREQQSQDLATLSLIADQIADQDGGVVNFQTEVALRQANYAEAIGDYTATIEAAQQVIALAKASQNLELEAAAYLPLGRALVRQGDYALAFEQLEQALKIARNASLQKIEADSVRFLAVVHTDLSNFDQARDYCQQALSIYHDLKDRQGEGSVLNNWGNVAHALGDYEASMNYWEKARDIFTAIGDREGLGRAFVNLGTVNMDQGNYNEAQAHYEVALEICREIDVPIGEFFALSNLSFIYHYQDNQTISEKYARSSLQVAQELGARPLEALALNILGHSLSSQDQLDEAQSAYKQALDIWEAAQQPNRIAETQAG